MEGDRLNDTSLEPWQHGHTFGQDRRRPGESRTVVVVCITLVMMAVEIGAGVAFGSVALLADGVHMASHSAALGISAFAYAFARRRAGDSRFSFGTGKVNALGGYTGAVLLLMFALVMVREGIDRFLHPVAIAFDQAILVAAAGLVVNGVSALILSAGRARGHGHGHGDGHAHGHEAGDRHHGAHHGGGHVPEHDHNLRSAYLHVLADALTSILAIVALLAGKFFGLVFLDPAMGIVGAALVTRWSIGLVRGSATVLLDRQGPEELRARIRSSLESDGDTRVAELHVWSIGPGILAAIIVVVATRPKSPAQYRDALPPGLALEHVTVEVHRTGP